MTFEDIYNTRTNQITGHMYEQESRLLYDMMMASPADGMMVEVGCDLGRSTTIFASVAQERGQRIYVIDNFSYDYNSAELFSRNMEQLGLSDTIVLWEMDSVEAAKEFKGKIDLLFVDADHTYDGVHADLIAWLPKVKKNGVAIFHDYDNSTFPGVKQAVDELTETWEVVGTGPIIIAKRKV